MWCWSHFQQIIKDFPPNSKPNIENTKFLIFYKFVKLTFVDAHLTFCISDGIFPFYFVWNLKIDCVSKEADLFFRKKGFLKAVKIARLFSKRPFCHRCSLCALPKLSKHFVLLHLLVSRFITLSKPFRPKCNGIQDLCNTFQLKNESHKTNF